MENNIYQEILIKELQKLRDKLIKEFESLYNHRGTPTTNVKLLDLRTDRLLGLQYAIKVLDMAIPEIKNGAKTGEVFLYLLMPLEMSAEFYKTLQERGKNDL